MRSSTAAQETKHDRWVTLPWSSWQHLPASCPPTNTIRIECILMGAASSPFHGHMGTMNMWTTVPNIPTARTCCIPTPMHTACAHLLMLVSAVRPRAICAAAVGLAATLAALITYHPMHSLSLLPMAAAASGPPVTGPAPPVELNPSILVLGTFDYVPYQTSPPFTSRCACQHEGASEALHALLMLVSCQPLLCCDIVCGVRYCSGVLGILCQPCVLQLVIRLVIMLSSVERGLVWAVRS